MKTKTAHPFGSTKPPESASRTRRVARFFRKAGIVLLVILAFIIASATGFFLWWNWPPKALQWLTNPFFPPEMEAIRYSPRDVLADLGGMPVKIPSYFADYVEYNGEPGWGDERIGPVPARTQASKIVSFGYDTRFTDMAGLSSPELIANKRSFSIYNTMWIRVGIRTGEIFPGTGFLDRRAAALVINSPDTDAGIQNYEKLPAKEYGLTAYAPLGINSKTKQPNRTHPLAEDVFVHRGKDGKVDAYIDCSNRPHHGAPCQQSFTLEPYANAKVSVLYRRGMLPHWQEIQRKVTAQIVGFNVSSRQGGLPASATLPPATTRTP